MSTPFRFNLRETIEVLEPSVASERRSLAEQLSTTADILKIENHHIETGPPDIRVVDQWRSGTEVVILAFRPDGMYRFASTIVAALPSRLILAEPDLNHGDRLQRRAFARVATGLPVELQVHAEHGRLGARVSARLYDLSAGGCALLLDEAPEEGHTVSVSIELPEEGAVHTDARVVRVRPKRIKGQILHWMALEFTSMPEGMRSQIVRHVFQVQRRFGKK